MRWFSCNWKAYWTLDWRCLARFSVRAILGWFLADYLGCGNGSDFWIKLIYFSSSPCCTIIMYLHAYQPTFISTLPSWEESQLCGCRTHYSGRPNVPANLLFGQIVIEKVKTLDSRLLMWFGKVSLFLGMQCRSDCYVHIFIVSRAEIRSSHFKWMAS